jgi:hypothetical protein
MYCQGLVTVLKQATQKQHRLISNPLVTGDFACVPHLPDYHLIHGGSSIRARWPRRCCYWTRHMFTFKQNPSRELSWNVATTPSGGCCWLFQPCLRPSAYHNKACPPATQRRQALCHTENKDGNKESSRASERNMKTLHAYSRNNNEMKCCHLCYWRTEIVRLCYGSALFLMQVQLRSAGFGWEFV